MEETFTNDLFRNFSREQTFANENNIGNWEKQ